MQNSLEYFASIRSGALDHLIYVVGSARGGTSVFRDALDVHDSILMLPEMAHFLNQVWRYRSKVHQRLLRQIFRLPSFYREDDVLGGLPEEKRMQIRRYIDKALSDRDLRSMWQLYPLIYALDSKNHKKLDEIVAWGDKANDFFAVEEAAKAFPEGKFIMLLRDPRSVATSQARRALWKESYQRGKGVDDLKLIQACMSWRNMTQKMLRFAKKYQERTILVKFEDVIDEPEATLNKVFKFALGLPLDEELLKERLRRLTYGATNDPAEKDSGLSTKSLDRWKTLLTEEQEAMVERVAGAIARKAGYDLLRSGERISLPQVVGKAATMKGRGLLLFKIVYLRAREIFL